MNNAQSDVAHPCKLALDVQERSASPDCDSRERVVFDANCLKKEAVDEPIQGIDPENALACEKSGLFPSMTVTSTTNLQTHLKKSTDKRGFLRMTQKIGAEIPRYLLERLN